MTMVSTEDLAARVRELRTRRQLKRRELAKLAGLSTDTIGRLERAQFSPTFDTLLKIAHALDLPVIALLADDYDQADELATLIRTLPEPHKQLAYSVVGALHVHAVAE